MRLYLAVALLMLAFVAYTEAQDDAAISEKFSEMAKKVNNFFQQIYDSEFAVKAREDLNKALDSAKDTFGISK